MKGLINAFVFWRLERLVARGWEANSVIRHDYWYFEDEGSPDFVRTEVNLGKGLRHKTLIVRGDYAAELRRELNDRVAS